MSINPETPAHQPVLDRVQIGQEPLPQGLLAGNAATSKIPEIKDLFSPSSRNYNNLYQKALTNTSLRMAEQHKSAVTQAEKIGDPAAVTALEEISLGFYERPTVREPDQDLLAEEMNKKEKLVRSITGHAEVNSLYGDTATFVAITPDGECIYGIGPETQLREYLLRTGMRVNNNFVNGTEGETRPDIPNPFDWYNSNNEKYPSPLDNGEYLDVVQQVDMMYQPPSDWN